MDKSTIELVSRLGRGPAVLFLGQRYLTLGTGRDLLLEQVAAKFGDVSRYDDLLDLGLETSADASLAWLDERCQRIAPPEVVEQISEFAWSSVITSAVDTVWPKVFRKPWRDMQPVVDERYRPADPRNRSRLHCLFLFGNVNRTARGERVPLTTFERLQRNQVAQALVRRLPELVTPLGTVVIEGYSVNDWLAPELLWPVLAALNPGQVHFFDPGGELAKNAVLGELAKRGLAAFHDGTFASALAAGVQSGLIRLGPPEAGGDLHQIQLEHAAVRIPHGIWNRVRTTATILDDAALVVPPSLSKDARYRDFRTFLGSGDGLPDWDAFARGFAFRRAFEAELKSVVDRALASPGVQEHPVILHGSTGSGKTVALASLARRVRLEHRYPVLYVERRAQAPEFGDIDLFCEWAEQAGAPATLIAWDGMFEERPYQDALRYLQSRGRNITIVGTSYRIAGDQARGRRFVEAPASLAEAERAEFLKFLRGFDEGLDELVGRQHAVTDESFLVALYRLLPPVRGVVRAGVGREIKHAEKTMALAAGQAIPVYEPRTQLAQALFDAGLLDGQGLSAEAEVQIGSERVNDFQHLTGLVMVPGRYGVRVPLELLLRTLGHDGFANFLTLLRDVDIFRWFEDASGNIEIGARSRLEASLIAEARAGGPETEAALIHELLLELRQDEDTAWGGREVDFAVTLLRAVEPSSEHSIFSGDYFQSFAESLTALRAERGVMNPRLMLQEAHYRREYARHLATGRNPEAEAVLRALDQAEEVVGAALELLPDQERNRALRSMLLVELASTMGTRSTQVLEGDDIDQLTARSVITSLREVVRRARAEDPTSYHPTDVLAWTTRNAIQRGLLDGPEKLEAITDVLSAFQGTEVEELDPRQVEQFHRRRYEIGLLIGDDDLSESAEQALREQGSGAALFIRALLAAGTIGRPDDVEMDSDRVRAAVQLMEDDADLLWRDARCLDLYLDLWWIDRTGQRLFAGERSTLGLTRPDWGHLLRVVEALQEQVATRRWALLGFLRGLAQFHLDRFADARATFKEVEHASMAVRSRRRVIRTYLASNPDGSPRVYHGTISWLDHVGRKGEIQVEELRSDIVFFTHDFRLDEGRVGRDIGEFHIAFNFLGPIADPVIFQDRR